MKFKSWLLAAASVLALCGVSRAELPTVPNSGGNYRLYIATDLAPGTNTIVGGTAFLHKVIVSSGAGVDISSMSVLDIYNSRTNASNPVAKIQLSTTNVTAPVEWTFNIALSSGFVVNHSTGEAGRADYPGKVTAIYKNGSPGYDVWQSSGFFSIDAATHVFTRGPVLLHKIMVLKKASATQRLKVYDSFNNPPAENKKVIDIDLSAAAREYTYNILFSTGMTFYANADVTTDGDVLFLYKKNPSTDYEMWRSTCVFGSVSAVNLVSGPAVLGGISNGVVDSTGELIVYDSNTGAVGRRAVVSASSTFDTQKYDLYMSSGITVTNKGSGQFTILYKKRQP